MCKNQCRMARNNCETVNQVTSIAQDALKANSKRPSLHGDSYQRSCSDYSCIQDCEETRQSCHIMCGGEVKEYKVCTAFCDQKANKDGLFSY